MEDRSTKIEAADGCAAGATEAMTPASPDGGGLAQVGGAVVEWRRGG